VPFAIIVGAILTLMLLVQVMFRPTRREMIIALFTGFVVTYLVLTVFGTSFRGPGQDLYLPWQLVGLEH
jgi:hypothetical protein